MTTDDLRTRAREAAEEAYRKPLWHVGTITDRLIEAFYDGYLAHAAQQPSRDIDVDELARVIGDRFRIAGMCDRGCRCEECLDICMGAAHVVRDYLLTGDESDE